MDESTFLNKLFDILESNMQFPAYQAERRIDIFINHFLEDILEEALNKGETQKKITVKFVAPEFPLIKKNGHQSTNVDYLCVTKRGNKVEQILFIELKTDAGSFEADQV